MADRENWTHREISSNPSILLQSILFSNNWVQRQSKSPLTAHPRFVCFFFLSIIMNNFLLNFLWMQANTWSACRTVACQKSKPIPRASAIREQIPSFRSRTLIQDTVMSQDWLRVHLYILEAAWAAADTPSLSSLHSSWRQIRSAGLTGNNYWQGTINGLLLSPFDAAADSPDWHKPWAFRDLITAQSPRGGLILWNWPRPSRCACVAQLLLPTAPLLLAREGKLLILICMCGI